MRNFRLKTKIIFGENSLDELLSFDFKKIFIISDPFVVTSNLIAHVTDRLKAGGKEFVIFDQVKPDPPVQSVAQCVAAIRETNPDALLCIGGGSALDTGKAAKYFSAQDGSAINIPMIAIPTTSGTGSEVTSFAVISDPETHQKIPVRTYDLVPEYAILDAVLVKSVPPKVVADTGMDVLTHAMESYVSVDANELSEALSEKAIEIVGQYLVRSYKNPDDSHARQKMHTASTLAGVAFDAAGLGVNHALAHQLGAWLHIPHGRANAILLPHVIEFNTGIDITSCSRPSYPYHVERYENIARILGLQNLNTVTTIRSLVNWVQFMLQELEIPTSISALGIISKEEYMAMVPVMAQAALKDTCLSTNPKLSDEIDLSNVYEKIW